MLCPCGGDLTLLEAYGSKSRDEMMATLRCDRCKNTKVVRVPLSVPASVIEGVQNYISYGTSTGTFLKAVLTNDLFEAFAKASEEEFFALGEIVKYVSREVPFEALGTVQKYEQWVALHLAERASERPVTPESVVHFPTTKK